MISKNNVAKIIGFTTLPKTILLQPLVLQHCPKQFCCNHWFYNISKTNVANTIVFSTCSKQTLLSHLTVDISKTNDAETNGFSNIVFGNVVKTLVLATVVFEDVVKPMVLATLSKAETTTNTTGTNVVKTIGFTYPLKRVAKTLGFTTFSEHLLLKYLTVDIPKNNVAETNGFSNVVFVNVAKPLVLATWFS